jgi:ABC-type nitrate/sulfonate/bicarbonate transport system substrate-binding protein
MNEVHLRVGTFTPSLLIHVARGDGSFRRVGLEVEESSVTSSPAQFLSLEAGELDLALTSPDNVLAYRFLSQNPLGRSLPVEILCAVDRGLGLSLVLGPMAPSVEDVRGAVVGVDVAQSGFAFIAYELLDRAGLAPGAYRVEALGSTPRRTSALIDGECAATVLNAGNELRAEGNRCTIVSEVTQIGPYLGTVVAALASNDSRVDETRRRFTDTLLETALAVVERRRDSQVVEAATSLLDLDEAQARTHLERMTSRATGLVPDGYVDLASMATLVGLRRRYLPTTELDSILDSLGDVVNRRAWA